MGKRGRSTKKQGQLGGRNTRNQGQKKEGRIAKIQGWHVRGSRFLGQGIVYEVGPHMVKGGSSTKIQGQEKRGRIAICRGSTFEVGD